MATNRAVVRQYGGSILAYVRAHPGVEPAELRRAFRLERVVVREIITRLSSVGLIRVEKIVDEDDNIDERLYAVGIVKVKA